MTVQNITIITLFTVYNTPEKERDNVIALTTLTYTPSTVTAGNNF